jgi:alpha-tubulin suppressor-like RCC1 family protein
MAMTIRSIRAVFWCLWKMRPAQRWRFSLAIATLIGAVMVASCGGSGGGGSGGGGGSAGATQAPSDVQQVHAVPASGQVTLTWEPVDSATSYTVYWSTSLPVGGGTTQTASASTTDLGYTATGLTNGTAYYFIVTASNDAGEGPRNDPVPTLPLRDSAVAIGAGAGSACGILGSGMLVCWGTDNAGQLGIGLTPDQIQSQAGFPWSGYPLAASGIDSARQVAVSAMSGCAIVATGSVWCWGDGPLTGQNTSLTPAPVSGISSATGIAVGMAHTCAVLSDQTVQCWGWNDFGKLGTGSSTAFRQDFPNPVPGLAGAISIVAGSDHTCVLLAGGGVECWGANNHGQVGTASGIQAGVSSATAVGNITTAAAIGAGSDTTCAVLTSGAALCWGDNTSGQLGNGVQGGVSATPVAVATVASATAIAVGNSHACVLTAGGTVECWGDNSFDQLGVPGIARSLAPITVPGLTSVSAIAAGENHTCALRSSGSIYCWGDGTDGQLGSGFVNPSAPRPVTGIVASGLVSIAIAPPAPVVLTGHSVQLTATGTYLDASTADLTGSVHWSSSDPTIATVSQAVGSEGVVTALGAGSVTITATDDTSNANRAVAGSVTLTVAAAATIPVTVTAQPSIGSPETNLTCFPGGTFLQPRISWHAYRDDGTPAGPGVLVFSDPTAEFPTASASPPDTNFYIYCVVVDAQGRSGTGYALFTESETGAVARLTVTPATIHAGATAVNLDGSASTTEGSTPPTATDFAVQYAGSMTPANLEGYLEIPAATWHTVFHVGSPASGLIQGVPAAVFASAGAYRAQLTIMDDQGVSHTVTTYFQVVP